MKWLRRLMKRFLKAEDIADRLIDRLTESSRVERNEYGDLTVTFTRKELIKAIEKAL